MAVWQYALISDAFSQDCPCILLLSFCYIAFHRLVVTFVQPFMPLWFPSTLITKRNCLYICRFMKLRLDRVLQDSFETDTLEEALASSPIDIEFEKPEKWTAPYAKYEYGWWGPFLPSKTSNVWSWCAKAISNFCKCPATLASRLLVFQRWYM